MSCSSYGTVGMPPACYLSPPMPLESPTNMSPTLKLLFKVQILAERSSQVPGFGPPVPSLKDKS